MTGLSDEYRQTIHELLAPDIFPVEVAQTLTRARQVVLGFALFSGYSSGSLG